MVAEPQFASQHPLWVSKHLLWVSKHLPVDRPQTPRPLMPGPLLPVPEPGGGSPAARSRFRRGPSATRAVQAAERNSPICAPKAWEEEGTLDVATPVAYAVGWRGSVCSWPLAAILTEGPPRSRAVPGFAGSD